MNRISDKICVVLGGIMIGFLFVPFIGYIWIQTQPSPDLMAAIVGIFVGIISISVPIIIGNLAKSLAIYNNQYIASILKQEKYYIRIRQLVLVLCILLILFLFFSLKETKVNIDWISRIIATIGVSLCIYALIVFKKFWDVSFEFAVNTDRAIMERVDAGIKKNLSFGMISEATLEYMDIYHQILVVKLQNKSYADLKDVFKHLMELTVKLLHATLSESHTNQQAVRAIFDKYYLSAYSCWQRSYRETSDEAFSIYSLYNQTLATVLASSAPSSELGTSIHPIFHLYQRIANDLTKKDAEGVPHCRQYPWEWYMTMLSDRNTAPEKLNLLDSYLLAAMRIVVHNGNKAVFEAYIAASIERILTFYSWEQPLRLNDNDAATSTKITNSIHHTFLLRDYDVLEQLIDNEIHNKDFDKEGLKTYITDTFKYNHLRLTVLILGAYCLFKGRYDYIRLLLNYNQPKESEVTFWNKDIVPTDIEILMMLYQNSPFLESLYHHVWEGHNDGQYWFKRFIALLFYRGSLNPHPPTLDLSAKQSKQDLEYLIYCVQEISSYFESFFTPRIIQSCGLPAKSKSGAMKYMESLKAAIQRKIESVAQTNELDPEKVSAFVETVKRNINEGSLWMTLSQKEHWQEGHSGIEDSFNIGYNRIIDKSFLAEGDRGIYVGFESSLASVIVNQIDYQIESRIRNRIRNKKALDDTITKGNYRTKLFELDDSWMIIFINYRKFIEWLPNSTSFKWEKRQSHMIGTTDKGTEIYSWGDPADRTSRAIAIQKRAIPHIAWKSSEDLVIEVKDLHIEKERKKEILEAEPQWLIRYETRPAKEEFLDKHVQILISGTIRFEIVSDAEICILDNI